MIKLTSRFGREAAMICNDTSSQNKMDTDCDIWLNAALCYTNELDCSRNADNPILKYHQQQNPVSLRSV